MPDWLRRSPGVVARTPMPTGEIAEVRVSHESWARASRAANRRFRSPPGCDARPGNGAPFERIAKMNQAQEDESRPSEHLPAVGEDRGRDIGFQERLERASARRDAALQRGAEPLPRRKRPVLWCVGTWRERILLEQTFPARA